MSITFTYQAVVGFQEKQLLLLGDLAKAEEKSN